MRLLHRFGNGGGSGELPVLALMLVVALPQLLQRRQHLDHHRHPDVRVQAGRHAVELPLVGALADAELETAARDQVQQRRLAGQLDWVPVRRDHHRGAEPDPVGVGRKMSEQLERAR